MAKRTTEDVLRGELLATKKGVEVALAIRDLRDERAKAAREAAKEADAKVREAISARDRSRAALEAFLGEKLPDEVEAPATAGEDAAG